MVIHLGGGDKRECRIEGDGIIHLNKSEHGCAVHSYAVASGPV